MKKKIALLSIAVAGCVYIAIDMARTAKERIFRQAAGESGYERTHRRKR